jgi:hypothetical protein
VLDHIDPENSFGPVTQSIDASFACIPEKLLTLSSAVPTFAHILQDRSQIANLEAVVFDS